MFISMLISRHHAKINLFNSSQFIKKEKNLNLVSVILFLLLISFEIKL